MALFVFVVCYLTLKRKEKEVASLLPIAPAWECIN
jgi:hypothetical protein